MAAKHLTRVLFLSALSSAISSSLSRSCSRQTFSSLVNTANSCGSHKAAFRVHKTNFADVWFLLAPMFHVPPQFLQPQWGLRDAHVRETADLSTGNKQTLPHTWDHEYEKCEVNNRVNYRHSFCHYSLVLQCELPFMDRLHHTVTQWLCTGTHKIEPPKHNVSFTTLVGIDL